MEVNFNIEKVLNMIPGTEVGFLDARNLGDITKENYYNLCQLLDVIGELSAKVRVL